MSNFKVTCRTFFYFTLFLILFYFVVTLKNRFIIYNSTISEPIGYYLTVPTHQVLKGNLYTIVIPQDYMTIIKALGYCADGTLLKEIVASSGDIVSVSDSGIKVNGNSISNSKSKLVVRNINLNPIKSGFTYKLKKGEYWVMGNTINSYDSRYFGVITDKQIQNHAIFLFNI